MKNIDKTIQDLWELGSGGTFRIYKKRSDIGYKILKDLIPKRDGVYVKNDVQYKGFYLNDKDRTVGLLSQLYGANGLLTLVNRYGVLSATEAEKSGKDELVSGIKSALLDVLDYVETNNYDMNPHIDFELNNELFYGDNRDNKYTGAMTWALSLFVSARHAIREGVIVFDEKANINRRLFVQIKKIMEYFVKNLINDDEGGLGWGYARGCVEPSLFFTYSVIEAYSDFEDNAITDTERDDELLDFLNEGIKNEADRLEIRYRNACFAIGDKTWEVYKDYIKDHFFTDRFDGKISCVGTTEIKNSARSSALFNSLYIIFIMFYSYVNSRSELYSFDKAKDRFVCVGTRSEEEKQTFIHTIGRAMQYIKNFYDDLKAEGKESIVDRHTLSFGQHNRIIADFGKLLNDESIQASSLLPMLVKASNLIALWIQKFPQQSMTDMFDGMLETKMEGKWLWENRRFDLLSTERYLEAVADYFDYYDKYEKNYAEKALKQDQISAQIEEKITQKYETKLKEQVKKLSAIQENNIRNTIEQSIRAEYVIEPVLNKKIADAINAAISQKTSEYLIATLEKIAKSYTQGDDGGLDGESKKIRAALEKYIESFVGDSIVNASQEREVPVGKIKDELRKDLKDFATQYLMFLADQSKNNYNPTRLSTILSLIEKA